MPPAKIYNIGRSHERLLAGESDGDYTYTLYVSGAPDCLHRQVTCM